MPSRLRPEDLLAAILSSNADGLLCFALDGTILTWSEGAAGLYGYSAEEIIGKSVTLLMPEAEICAHEEFVRGAHLAAGRHSVTNAERLRNDGLRMRVCVSRVFVPSVNGSIVAVMETARLSAGLAADERPYPSSVVLAQMPAVGWTTDRALRITSSWGAELDTSQTLPGELAGRPLHEFLRCQDAHAAPVSQHVDALQGTCSQFEYNRGGRCFEMRVNPLRGAAGEIVGSIAAGIDISARKQCEEHIRHQASHDALTGLANYREFSETLEREVRRATRSNHTFGLLLLDLDDLKRVNDRYGHLAGNSALRRVAEIIQEHCRATDVAARYGGDEFAVVLVDADSGMARNIAARIAAAVRKDARRPALSASIGCAMFPEDGRDARELVEAADEQLYKRKKGARTARMTA